MNINRWEIKSFEEAEKVAVQLTEETGVRHVATDAGEWVSPRYYAVRVPQIGDEVSYGFNGDYYPDGHITSVSDGPKMVIKTSGGHVYYRRNVTGSWVMKGGTWRLVRGYHCELNPSF